MHDTDTTAITTQDAAALALPAPAIEATGRYLHAQVAPAMLSAYQSDFAVFAAWCASDNGGLGAAASPATPEVAAAFLAAQADAGVKVSRSPPSAGAPRPSTSATPRHATPRHATPRLGAGRVAHALDAGERGPCLRCPTFPESLASRCVWSLWLGRRQDGIAVRWRPRLTLAGDL